MIQEFTTVIGLALAFITYRVLDRLPPPPRFRQRALVGCTGAVALGVTAGVAGWFITRSAGAALALSVAGALARWMVRDWRLSRAALAHDREVQSLAAVTAETLAVHPAATHTLLEVALGAPWWLQRGLVMALGHHATGVPLRAALEGWALSARRRDLALYARLVAEAHETSAAAVESLRRLSVALRRRADLLARRHAELAGQRILLAAAILAPPAAFGALMVAFPWVREWYTATKPGHVVSAAGALAWTATLALAWRVAWRDER